MPSTAFVIAGGIADFVPISINDGVASCLPYNVLGSAFCDHENRAQETGDLVLNQIRELLLPCVTIGNA